MGGSYSSRLGDISDLERKAKQVLKGSKHNVFISFASEDLAEVNLLRGQKTGDISDIEFNDNSVRVPYKSERADYIKKKIEDKIKRCSETIVYISPHTKNSKWVKWEVEKSLELGKKVIAVHKGKTFTAGKPQWITSNMIKTIPWAKLANELKKS